MQCRWTRVAALFLVILLVVGCGSQSRFGPQQQPEGPKRGGTLVVGANQPPQILDPALNVAWASTTFYEHIYECLMGWAPNDQIVPGLAESYEVSPDGKVYTFKLRRGVKFHNGRELVADDVKFVFERMLDPKTGSPNISVWQALEKVEVVDKYTVRFTLKEPFAPFLAYLATPNYSGIYPKEAVGQLATHPVGTGPFVWSEYVRDQHVKMTRNPNYWQKDLPYVDELIFKLIIDDGSQVSAIRSKTVDMTWLSDPKVAATVPKVAPGVKLLPSQTTRFIDIKFNLKKPPFNDVRVRRAFSLAIDRQALVDTVLGGYGQVGTIITTESFKHPNPLQLPYYTPDLAKARQLLQEAGVTNLKVEWKVVAINSLDVQMSQMVKEQLAKVGITVNINPTELGTILNDWAAGNYEMISVGVVWVPDVDGEIYLRFHSSTPFAQNQGLKDEELDRYFEQGRTATNLEDRKQAYIRAQERLADQAYNIVLYTYPLRWEVAWDYVKGYQPLSGQRRIYLRHTWLDK